MLRRLLILLPALALVVWLVAAQLPLWTAPQPNWFAPGTPGTPEIPGACAAVESLKLYAARRVDPGDGIGREAAQAAAEQVVAAHYDVSPLVISEPLMVEAALPGSDRRAYAVVTALLSATAPAGSGAKTAAVIYLDAATGEPGALITAIDDPASTCDFDVRAALVDAVKSPPLLLLAAYVLIVVGVLLVRWFSRRRLR